MKSASAVFVFVALLLGGSTVASAGLEELKGYKEYSLETPGPTGVVICELSVGGTKAAGVEAKLDVVLLAKAGEAEIPEFGLGDGIEQCDLFPNSPVERLFPLPTADDRFFYSVTIHIHAQSDNCTKGAHAAGVVVASAFYTSYPWPQGLPPTSRMSPLVCGR